MAKLQTKNKAAIYNAAKAELYDNVNQIMQDAYRSFIETRKDLEDENSPNWFGNYFGGTLGTVGALLFDAVKGIFVSETNARNAIFQSGANFLNNVQNIFDESDGVGWKEDAAFTFSSIPANLIKGIGTAGFSIGGGIGEVLGVEGSLDWAEKQTRKLEDYVNVNIIGAAVEEAKYGDILGRVGSQFLLGDTPEGEVRKDIESEFDDAEYIRKYINSRWNEKSAGAKLSRQSTANTQRNLSWQEPIGEVLDKYVDKTYLGNTYDKYIEPAAQSIGEILPAIAMSVIAGGASSPQAAAALNNLAKAYFVSNAYGRSHLEAVELGASSNDAHLYAMGVAAIELGSESFGGFVPGKALSTTYRSVISSMTSEFVEEAIAEVSQPGLNFWLDENRNFEKVDKNELRERAFYAGIIGGISGGVFGLAGRSMAKKSPNAEIEIINRELDKRPNKRNDQVIAEQINKLIEKLNDPKVPQWQKDQILRNPFYREAIEETQIDVGLGVGEGGSRVGYKLSDVGRRFAQGQLEARQGNEVITKEEYAVGAQEYATDYLERNEFGEIKIIKNEEVENLNEKQQKDVAWFRKRNLRVVFMKQEKAQDGSEAAAFTDLRTGTIYINLNAKSNQNGVFNAFAHEMFHQMTNQMKRTVGTVIFNKKQKQNFDEFMSALERNELDFILKEVGWEQLEEIYARQMFTPEQEAKANEVGWENVELNDEQKAKMVEEKFAKIIDSVFNNEKLLKRAYNRKPQILRKIGNIFARFRQDFGNQLDLDEDSSIVENIEKMQKNFLKMLREGEEFAFGSETVVEGLLQRRIYKETELFTNQVFMVDVHKPKYEVIDVERDFDKDILDIDEETTQQVNTALDNVLKSEEALNTIIGYIPNYDFNTKPQNSIEEKIRIDQDFYRINEPRLLRDEEIQYYKETYGDEYDFFFKVGERLYDKNDFQLPKNTSRLSIQFIDNDYFDLSYLSQTMEEIEQNIQFRKEVGVAPQVLNQKLFGKKIRPYIEKNDGKLLKAPVSLNASMNQSRFDSFMQNGFLTYQSMNMQSGTAQTLKTQEYEQVFEGEDGHRYTMTLFMDSSIVQENGFQIHKGDGWTPIVINPPKESDIFDPTIQEDLYEKYNIDKSKELLLRTSYPTTKTFFPTEEENAYFKVEFNRKADVLRKTIMYIVNQNELLINDIVPIEIEQVNELPNIGEENVSYKLPNSDDLYVYDAENETYDNRGSMKRGISLNLSRIAEALDNVSRSETSKISKYRIKSQINQQRSTNIEMIKRAQDAVIALNTMLSNYSLGQLGKMLDYRNNFGNLRDFDLIEAADKYYKELIAIEKFMNDFDYDIDKMSEAKHPKVLPNMISAAYITHLGGNKNSPHYQERKKFLEDNGIFVKDLINEKTIADLYREEYYSLSPDMKVDIEEVNLDMLHMTSTYATKHIDKGNQSVVDNALKDDIKNNLNIMFKIDTNATTQPSKSEAKKQKDKSTQPIVNEIPQETKQDYDEIQKTRTPLSQPTMASNPSTIVNAQKIAQQQTDEIYRQINKDFTEFIEKDLENLKKKKQKQYKELVEIYNEHQQILGEDARGRRYVNHVTSAALKSFIMESYKTYQKIEGETPKRSLSKVSKNEINNIVDKVNEAIFSTVKYLDIITSKRYRSDSNPTGMIFAKYSHWYLRDLLNADLSQQDVLRQFIEEDRRGEFYRRFINSIENMNQKDGFKEIQGATRELFRATDVKKVNDLSLRTNDTQRTHDDVKKQWAQNAKRISQIKEELDFKTEPPLGFNSLIDPFSYLEIQGLFGEQSWASVLYKKLVEAQGDMIEIDRIFDEIIDSEGWLKNNYREIKNLERKSSAIPIKNLGNVKMRMSQVIFLRNMLGRELVRNKAINKNYIDGNLSKHFDNGNYIDILEITDNPDQKYDKKTSAQIQDNLELLKELDKAILDNPIAFEYNQKVQELFTRLYPYINERFVEINGQTLQNDGQEIKNALDGRPQNEIDDFFDEMPSTITLETVGSIYTPIYIGRAGYLKQDELNLQNILNVGVFDGITQSIREESNSRASVESITNVIYKYTKEVRNYYGMHRIMSDWNTVINEAIEGETQQTNLREYISFQTIRYVEDLLKDIAGYSKNSSYYANKATSYLRRNFYRAALAGNLKVIFTQLTTIYNLSVIYGDSPMFFPMMYKNLFMQLSPKNKKIVEELSETNNIFYDRSKNPTFDIGQATKDGIDSNSLYSRIINMFMSGISITDNSINKAFYLTLLESENPDTGALYSKEEANALLNKAILQSQSSALDLSKAPILRTENEILKSMVKFMGEPLKLQSQIYVQSKKLDYIKKLEQKRDDINAKLNQQEAATTANFVAEFAKLRSLEAKENDPSFASLNEDKQKEIRKEIEKQEKVYEETKKEHDETIEQINTTKQEMDVAILSKSKTRNGMFRRVSALMGAMTFMASLGVFWKLVLSDMGYLDDREEEEELAKYLARKFGVQIGNEFAGLFPIVRDIYGYFFEGYNIDTIDELTLLQGTANTLNNLIRDIVESDREFNPYEHARDIAVFGARLISLPARNIENLAILAMMTTGNQDAYYRYRSITNQRTASNKELARAVADGNDEMVMAIVETRLASREIAISSPVMNEITNLARVGSNVTMTGIRDSYTIDGIEYAMTPQEKSKFRAIYNQADLVIQKVITSKAYNRLSDSKKASLLKSIYNYYLRLAQDTVLGVDVLPESRTFRTLNQVFAYFTYTVAPSLYRQQRQERLSQ